MLTYTHDMTHLFSPIHIHLTFDPAQFNWGRTMLYGVIIEANKRKRSQLTRWRTIHERFTK